MENFPIGLEWTTGINQLRNVDDDVILLTVGHFINIHNSGYSSLKQDQIIDILSKSKIAATKAQGTCTAVEQLTSYILDNADSFNKDKFAKFLEHNTILEPRQRDILVGLYEKRASSGKLEKAIRLGKLLKLGWSIRNYRQMNEIKEINTMMVILDFQIADPYGQPRAESMILSLSDFKALLNKVKEIKDSLVTF
eukprot:TRINITY_DN689_c0_g4_i3.p1 TRINITY_DN689_c0_g4~~TRINITY_DN689_c0_g4_i3.p1  ORF type:complete len:195 (+),score=30.62 TRINITY_DN689_c0_g4_i3:131-715(+)